MTLIDEAGKFALIDNGQNPAPPVGSLLRTYQGSVQTGELVTTDVRKHPFTIADLHSGVPRKGDRVILFPPGSPAPMATPVPAATPVPTSVPTSG